MALAMPAMALAMNDMGLDTPSSWPAGQPEAVPARSRRRRYAVDLVAALPASVRHRSRRFSTTAKLVPPFRSQFFCASTKWLS